MLESGSALEDETLTIRFVILENPEIFSRKYPAAHLDEITTKLPFFDSRRKRVKSSHCGLSWLQSSQRIKCNGSSASICYIENILKIIQKTFMALFVKKMSFFSNEKFGKSTI